jgi:glutathione S-transferase
MALALYSVPISIYSAKTRILLRHKGLDWQDLDPPGGYGSAEFKRIVPSGNLPTLVDGGLMIADSEAIAEYLEEAYPDPPALPRDLAGRARARERSRFNDTRLEPEVRRLFPHVRPARREAAALAAIVPALQARLDQLGQMLEAVPDAGLALTLGDCGLAVTLHWVDLICLGLDIPATMPETVNRYRARLTALPAIAAEMAAYLPKAREWMDLALRDQA